MGYIGCGDVSGAVYSNSNGRLIQYVRTIDCGPCLTSWCGTSYCNYGGYGLLGDLTTALFQAMGHNLSEGVFLGYEWQ